MPLFCPSFSLTLKKGHLPGTVLYTPGHEWAEKELVSCSIKFYLAHMEGGRARMLKKNVW